MLPRTEQFPLPFKLTLPQATLLSYLTGLGPVGSPVEVGIGDLAADLGYKNHRSFYTHLSSLMGRGFVMRLTPGYRGRTGVLAVKKRLEDHRPPAPVLALPVGPRRAAKELSISEARQDAYARLAEIPRDDRTPAQRLMGDPIGCRSALWAKRREEA